MKRVKAACICQILHFTLKDDLSHNEAIEQVIAEVEQYQKSLDRNRTRYKIVEKTEQPDSSIMIKVIKQYNSTPVGNYLD